MSIVKLSVSATVTIIGIGALLYFWDTPRKMLGEFILEPEANVFPYAFANEASTRYYNEDGSLNYIFESEKLSHFRPDNLTAEAYTSVENLKIVVFQDDVPWTIEANLGRVTADQVISLLGDVTITSTNKDGSVITMESNTLAFDTLSKLVNTDEPVTITSPLGVLTAVGMVANINEKKFRLLNNVKGRHEPKKSENQAL